MNVGRDNLTSSYPICTVDTLCMGGMVDGGAKKTDCRKWPWHPSPDLIVKLYFSIRMTNVHWTSRLQFFCIHCIFPTLIERWFCGEILGIITGGGGAPTESRCNIISRLPSPQKDKPGGDNQYIWVIIISRKMQNEVLNTKLMVWRCGGFSLMPIGNQHRLHSWQAKPRRSWVEANMNGW